ncbi:hypothetical protein FOZ62_028801 [Perkinsus olseni]|uniref:Uncharacterized protein n=2 Tax=Perkinsus olseni TaxID=32597 RepID=A0A7J6UD01_PEROL|nr:hypothetical protein FOZ62_028801 [Perkinsus olseni]
MSAEMASVVGFTSDDVDERPRPTQHVNASHLAALRIQLLEARSGSFPECLESLIWAYLLPLTINGPDKCVRVNIYDLPVEFEPLASPCIFDPSVPLLGAWETGFVVAHGGRPRRIARLSPGTGTPDFPFGRSRDGVAESHAGMEDEVSDAAVIGNNLYYVTTDSQDVLNWWQLAADGGDYQLRPSLRVPGRINELKLTGGHLFLLIGFELYLLVLDPGMGVELVCELPPHDDSPTGEEGNVTERMMKSFDDLFNHGAIDVVQDVLVRDGRVTHVLFTRGHHNLCILRPDGFIFEASVPGYSCCRFVPHTNGTVVAGVFGDCMSHGFNVYNIYEDKVPAISLDMGNGPVLSIVISSDWRVSVVAYNRDMLSSVSVTNIRLSRVGIETDDYGFNSDTDGYTYCTRGICREPPF